MKILWGVVVVIILLVISCLRPVPQPTLHNTYTNRVTVNKVFEGTSSDIVFNLMDDRNPYINRGLELGVDLKTWKCLLENQTVKMTFIKHWTPLASDRSIAKIELNDGRTIFNNID